MINEKKHMSGMECLKGEYANQINSSIWIEKLLNYGFPKHYKGIIKIEYSEFCEILNNHNEYKSLVDEVIKGKIIILKNALSAQCVDNLKNKSVEFWKNNEDTFNKMYENCKNFHRVIDDKRSEFYSIKAIKHSSYIFPWNEDFTSSRNEINNVWSNLKIFQGLKKDAFEKNTPKDKIVDRIQICLYPPKIGYLQTHTDPTHNQLIFISGYLSKRGSPGAYSSGGFYAVDINKNKVDLEDNINEGDMSFGMATIMHGVSTIDPDYSDEIDWYGYRGRWFLGLYSNDSDEVVNRITAKQVD
jgi:hypothetical protein